MFQVCDLKTQQRLNLQEEENFSKRELIFLVDSLRDFLKMFDKACRCLKFPWPIFKIERESSNSKSNLSARYYNDFVEHPIRQLRVSFQLENNNSRVFSIKKFELHDNQFILKLLTLTIAKFTTSTRTDNTLKQVWHTCEQIQCVAQSPLVVGKTIAF